MNNKELLAVYWKSKQQRSEHYPLSLNALTNACNQKSNRAPVLDLSQQQVQATIAELIDLRLVTEDEGLSGRVSKYDHRFCNTQFSHLQFNPQQRAIICLLLLRGAQTPGELKTRCARLADFTNVDDVEAALAQLIENSHVKKLPRESGKRDSRYIHLFTAPSAKNDEPIATQTMTDELENRELNDLLAEIDELKAQLKQIKEYIGL